MGQPQNNATNRVAPAETPRPGEKGQRLFFGAVESITPMDKEVVSMGAMPVVYVVMKILLLRYLRLGYRKAKTRPGRGNNMAAPTAPPSQDNQGNGNARDDNGQEGSSTAAPAMGQPQNKKL